MSERYLERIKIDTFGALVNRVVGPFSPGLNVVYGPNEAGKTTVSSFIGGVLFGWERAHGDHNTYKPANAERSGSLFFAHVPEPGVPGSTDEAVTEVSRAKNAEGLVGDASVVADLDKETFRTMFSLTSDELRSLGNTTDVTAKLLTAGSGTNSSPAHALAIVQSKIDSYLSRAAANDHSLVNLGMRRDELLEEIARAEAEVERLKRDDREFHDIEPEREDVAARIESLNRQIESLSACRANVEKLEEEIAELEHQISERSKEEASVRREHRTLMGARSNGLEGLSESDERKIRDRLEALSSEQAKVEHAVDMAKDTYLTSKAQYDALIETQSSPSRGRRGQRNTQIALSIVLPALFVLIGVPLFVHGREITSLSFTALGAVLVGVAIVMASAALVMLFRPDKQEEEREEREQSARWVMVKDGKKLEVCQGDAREFQERLAAALETMGLAAAEGSIRRARALLDDARTLRADASSYVQRRQAIAARRAELEEELTNRRQRLASLYERAGVREGESIEKINAIIDKKSKRRASLMETSERLNSRYGELKQELYQAQQVRRFDELKLSYHEVMTRMDESHRDFARLLLARRMLESAIAAWESKSQPEVYRQASRLFSSMTDGKWVRVSMTDEGKLEVVDAVRTRLDPQRLSLGTCQQLYLALRIALLITADNVGRSIPILADDILVNFDAARRASAARALAELAEKRQVILFTCHEEVVDAMRKADGGLNVVAL